MKYHFKRLIALVLVLCMILPMVPAAQAANNGNNGKGNTSQSSNGNGSDKNDKGNNGKGNGSDKSDKTNNGNGNGSDKNDKGNNGNGNGSDKNDKGNNGNGNGSDKNDKGNNGNGNGSDKNNKGNNGKGNGSNKNDNESTPNETTPPVQDSSDERGMGLDLVEDQTTVSPMVMMRASVYAAGENDPAAQAELSGKDVVYYSSTFFDYDKDAIDQSMADLDVKYAVDHSLSTSANDWKWKGLYFGYGAIYDSRGNSTPDRTKSRTGIYETGEATYTRANSVRYSGLASSNVTNSQTSYYYNDGDTYYPVYVTRTSRTSWFTTYYTYTLYANGEQIWTSGETTSTNTTVSGVTLYTRTVDGITVTSANYEDWVIWGLDDEADNGGYIHSGMVSGLVDGVPQFDDSYASRLFDSSALDGKTRYTNVGLPFIYEDGYYTFDSSFNGAYFPNGEAKSDVNLSLLDAPIVQHGFRNGSTKVWSTSFMPFNAPVSDNKQNTTIYQTDGTEQSNAPAYRLEEISSGYNPPASYNHFFSMITNIAFTMTANGRKYANDDESAPIIFEFSGDDDVWVFVDDVLVLDLGGIHDAVSGKIDFEANEVTFETCASGMAAGDATTGENTTGDAISQGAIFNDGETVGMLNTTRSTFAATDNHVLTIVYVERGANLSNCKIRFNLPQKDYIAVTKQIDENLYSNKDETTVVDQISNELFETLNARNFTYVLYENGKAMIGVRFSRYDANGNFVGNGSTASDGTFNVKNGETVRFYDVEFDGKTEYYVAELDPDTGSTNNAWGAATWAHEIRTAYGDDATVINTTKPNGYYVSQTIATLGSEEAVDVIYFTNTNKLLSPVADIANDQYVIDFGVAVELNPLANDTYSATTDKLTLAGISLATDGTFGNKVEGKFGTLEIKDGKVVYTLNEQFTGAEVFYYQVGLTSGADDLEDVYGTVTIMPATTMYYEEDFAGLNLELTGAWEDKGTAQGGYQEEGRVGTTSDSPYGSDKLYKNNSGDSYGTSKYVNTDSGSASFSYTFTGTGTALYARTSDQSAYMMITVTNVETGETFTWNRNTIYKPVEETELTDNTLYNIPVFTYEAEYGTYTVKVDLSKAIKVNASYFRGCDFYLDGVRVYNPANAYSGSNASATKQIEDAYARDGEAYITVDSLRNKLLLDSTKYSYVLDENGDYVLDEYGDPMYEIEWDGVNYVVFTDSNGEIKDAQTYQSAGPKEEVYLKAGQSVTFSLDNWDQNRNKVFLGIKAPSGSGIVIINGQEIDINNTTDIYYDITKYAEVAGNVATFKITADSALISVTTIKVTGTAEFIIITGAPELPELPDDTTPEDGE